MIKLSRRFEYCLMALKELSESRGVPLSVKGLVDKAKIPFDTTSHVLQKLVKVNILKSTQGPKGGYSLNCDLSEISIIKLCEIVEGQVFSPDCTTKSCELENTCNIRGPVQDMHLMVFQVFNQISVQQLFDGELLTQDGFFLRLSADSASNSTSHSTGNRPSSDRLAQTNGFNEASVGQAFPASAAEAAQLSHTSQKNENLIPGRETTGQDLNIPLAHEEGSPLRGLATPRDKRESDD